MRYMKPHNVVSLFEGMGCGAIALKDLGVKVGRYYSSEIDKWALMQFKYMFPEYTQVGDVTKWREWDIEWSTIDLIYGGSPCTGFSMAGKRLNFNDPQSKLFFVYVDILNHAKKHNPNVIFMLENVQMKKEWQAVINEYVGLFPVMIDAALVSAQTRKRLYWSNGKTRTQGLWNEVHTDIPQPKDRHIYLKDVLESDVDEKYYLKEEQNTKLITPELIDKIKEIRYKYLKIDKNGKLKSNQDKVSTFTAGAHSGGNHSDMDLICVAMRGRNPNNPNERTAGAKTEQRLEPNEHGKTNCLTSVSKDNLILGSIKMGRTDEAKTIRKENSKKGIDYSPFNLRQITGIDTEKMSTLLANPNPLKDNLILGCDIRKDEGIRIRENGKSGTLTARARTDESCGQNVFENYRIRRLTPKECMNLQSVPEWYKWHPKISESQQYKMLGNGWNCAVIKHNFIYILNL